MLALAKSHAGALLLNGAPEGYPLGHPVDGVQQIPCLTSVTGVQAPDALCAFNDRGRTADPRPTGLHFFRNDEALPPLAVCTRRRHGLHGWSRMAGARTYRGCDAALTDERRTTTTTSHPGSQRVVSSLSRPTDPAEMMNGDPSSSEVSR